jgi:superfamily II DNA or RNA helicase
MQLPEFLQPYQSAAKRLLADNCVTDLEFSGATYQIQVTDPKTHQKQWAFIQLNPNSTIKDSFCSCHEDQGEEEVVSPGCVHLATAYLYIFKGNHEPLHKRFQVSFWNQICQLYAMRLGYSADILKKKSAGHYQSLSPSGKTIFDIMGKNAAARKHLEQIIEHRSKETEETSLKFSNLTPEELTLWHEGKPSAQLSYELSFWSDLAKWFMKLQEQEAPYKILFEEPAHKLPNWIKIDFKMLQAGFYISEANLPIIIPSLATVNSPLKVYDERISNISEITYNKETESLIIKEVGKTKNSLPSPKKKALEGIEVQGWVYVPKDGFYAKGDHQLLQQPKIEKEEISKLLNENAPTIRDFFSGVQLSLEPVTPSYQIFFDSSWNLHIVSYIFEPGDLTQTYSRIFGDWVYLEDDGFYKVDGNKFDQIETVIKKDQVAEFITQNRSWLNTQPGFHTHLINVESYLIYKIDDMGRLTFDNVINVKESGQQPVEFNNWVYLPGQGFYQKINAQVSLPIRPGTTISAEQIPLFIKMHRDELSSVPGFFSKKNPIKKMGLEISLNDNNVISIHPEYERNPEYLEMPLRFYDDYVYSPEEGFHQLPIESKIPERFRHPAEIDPQDQDLFLSYELSQLIPYAFVIDTRLMKPKEIHLVVENMEHAEKLGQGWYSVKLSYNTEIGKEEATHLWEAHHKKKRFVFSHCGLIDLDEPNFNWIKHLGRHRIDKKKKCFFLSTLDILRISAFEKLELPHARKSSFSSTKTLLEDIIEFKVPEAPNIEGLKTTLRPYQETGLHWLWFLYHQFLSGLLCDDMGLGKTIQAMALMQASILYNQKKEAPKKHYLVICPTSVIYHWQDKLHTYLPHLKVCTFYGTKRSFEDFHQRYDVLLTSYGIWRLESEVLNQEPYEIAIFDEIQVAKNHNSLLHASLLKVKSRMRLGMTGTPIENRLRELKALFDIILPSYMPSDVEFREFFVKPVERDKNIARRQLLSRFVKPFILRRKKDEVLTELPEKTEDISYCALLPDQLSLYQQVLESSRKKIIQEMEGEAIPYMHVFALLTKLKQICDHPAVYWQNAPEYKKYQSGKWQLFVELLNEARDSGQKVVVFSQYLSQLDIIQLYLQEHKIGYAAIRGSTTNRGEEIKRFHNDPQCEVFVASLQAAGLGIDLTPASVVIHYDRWWNAARENQATDRVHRIGQQRGVQVLKLVTRSTFEERINSMIETKGQLMENVITSDDQSVLKLLNKTDILQLLQDVHLSKEDQTEVLPDIE